MRFKNAALEHTLSVKVATLWKHFYLFFIFGLPINF